MNICISTVVWQIEKTDSDKTTFSHYINECSAIYQNNSNTSVEMMSLKRLGKQNSCKINCLGKKERKKQTNRNSWLEEALVKL